MRTGLLLVGVYPPHQMKALAMLAEAGGYDTLWHGDDKFYRDTTVDLTLCAICTQRLELGTAILEPYTRHPALVASTVAALDEVSQGRMVVGLGAGGSGFEALGIERARPVRRVQEAITVMRAVWAGGQVDFDGETISFHGRLRFPALRPSIPIVIGTRGPGLCQLAGEIADGILISTCADPTGVRDALSHIETGAQRAGRSLKDLRLICRLDCCVADDPAQARQAVKPMLVASLKSSYPNWQFLEPVELHVPDAVREAIASRDRERIAAVAPLLPDSFAEKLSLAGTPEEIAQRVRQIEETGISEIGIYPIPLPGQPIEEQIIAFQSILHKGRKDSAPAARE